MSPSAAIAAVMIRHRLLAGAAGVASALALTACGTGAVPSQPISGKPLAIYTSVPLSGPESAIGRDVLDAEQLALHDAGGKVGKFSITLRSLNDATSSGWSPRLVADAARAAAQASSSIAYVGEIDPNATVQSLPIVNAAGLLQVSPYDSTIGLTRAAVGDARSPGKYLEPLNQSGRTFGRVVPSDSRQADAQLQVMKGLGVKRLFVADDGTPYGDAIAYAVRDDASKYGIAASAPASAEGFAKSGADALFYGGVASAAAVQTFNAAAGGGTKVKLFGPSGLYSATFAAQLSPAAGRVAYLSEPGLTPAELPAAGRAFLKAFGAAYGHAPAPQAIFGYAAVKAVLASIGAAGSNGNNPADVAPKFFTLTNVDSVLGTYSIDKQGDTSLAPYLFSRVSGGKLVPFKSLIVH